MIPNRHRPRLALAALLAYAVSSGACAKQPPEVTAAHIGSSVLETAEALQRGITRETDAKVLPVALAQKLTGYTQIIYDKSGPLGEALRRYHAATTIDLKNASAAEIQAGIAEITQALNLFLKEPLPAGIASELSSLAANVMAAIASVQAEVAKSLGK